MKNKKTTLLFTTAFLTVFFSYAQTFSTNTTPVGMEHNLLFNATSRYTVSQTGLAQVNLEMMFDGKFNPSYTSVGPTSSSPTIITIEGLPKIHRQSGAWVGWSTRYWQSKNFLIEGYDEYYNKGWITIADHSVNANTSGRSFSAKISESGAFTKLRFTFYSAVGANGRLGLSELFFIHPEATTPYAGLGLGSWSKDGTEVSTIATKVTTNKLLAKGNLEINTGGTHSSITMGSEVNDRIYVDNREDKYYGGGMWFRINKRDDSGYIDTMMLDDLGNVGIGQRSPQEKLHINGSIRGNASGGALRVQTTSGYLDLGAMNTGYAHIYTDRPKVIFNKDVYTTSNAFSSYNNDLILKTKGAERLRINDDSGNVGIGTTNPKNKLSVNGSIWAKKVKIELTDAADWVFEEDYSLRSLTEVEKFIKAYKHLPEIPSAEEFRENDMEVSEMTNKLLQKIEELTLYTIGQEKQLQAQKEKIEELEAAQLQNKEVLRRLADLEKLFKTK